MRALRTASIALLLLASPVAAAQEVTLPSFSVGNHETAKHRIEIFLSPTCTDCGVAFARLVVPMVVEAGERSDLYLLVNLVPRNQSDLVVAKILTCVPQASFAPFVIDWFSRIKPGFVPPRSELEEIGRKHGFTDESNCSAKSEEVLKAINHLIFNQLRLKETPVVFVDKQHYPNTFFAWQVESAIQKKNPSFQRKIK